MNPARKKVPYPICGIGSRFVKDNNDQYCKIYVSNLTTAREVVSEEVEMIKVLKDNKQKQKQLILDIMKQNTRLLQEIQLYDQQISISRVKLTQLEKQYKNCQKCYFKRNNQFQYKNSNHQIFGALMKIQSRLKQISLNLRKETYQKTINR